MYAHITKIAKDKKKRKKSLILQILKDSDYEGLWRKKTEERGTPS